VLGRAIVVLGSAFDLLHDSRAEGVAASILGLAQVLLGLELLGGDQTMLLGIALLVRL